MAPSIKHRYTGVEYLNITSYSINFKKELFKLEDLYVVMYEWFVENGYATRDDHKFPEKYFLHKVGAKGTEVWVRWRLQKNPFPGQQPFWRFDINVDMFALGLQEVEVVVQNQKVKANKGEVEVQVAANLIMDANNTWSKSPLLKPFKRLYFERILVGKRDMLKKKLYSEAFEFRDTINNYLQLETFMPAKGAKAEFWPRRQ